MKNWIIVLLTMALLGACNRLKEKKELNLSICKEVDKTGCIPPLVQGEVAYFFPRAITKKRLGDYINDIYFAGDTLAFAFVNVPADKQGRSQWSDLRANYHFPESDKKETFAMERIDHHGRTIVGFSLVGTILEKYHRERLSRPFHRITPVVVRYQFWQKEKLLASRTIQINIR